MNYSKYEYLTVDELKDLLIKKSQDLNKTITLRDLKKYDLPSVGVFLRKFNCNSWNDVLKYCCLVPTKKLYKYLDEELLNILRDRAKEIGKSPTKYDLGKNNSLPSDTIFYEQFKTQSWNKILELAGLKLNHFQGYTKEYALERLKDYYNTYNKILTRKEFQEYNLTPAYDWYRQNFGSYKQACFEAKLIDKPLTDEERIKISIDELVNLANKLNKCPTVAEYEEVIHKGFQRRNLEEHLNLKYNDICKNYIPKFIVNSDRDIDPAEIIENLKIVCKKLGRPPFYIELRDFGLHYSYNLFESKFHMSYNQLISSMGYDPSGTTTFIRSKEEMLDDFNKLFIKLKRVPYIDDLNKGDVASWSTYVKYFDSIENVCKLLDIDYDKYYKNTGAGTTCLDKNGSKCRSFTECVITNFYIDNGLIYEKEPKYIDITFIKGDRRKFDWSLIVNGKKLFVEYAGMYYPNKKRNTINDKYIKKINDKIKDLKDIGVYDQCLFIYPEDIKTKTLKEIFEPFLGIELNNGNTYKINSVEYFTMTSQELLDTIMKYSIDQHILPSTSIITKKESGIYKEIIKRFKSYNNFALNFGMTIMCPPKQNIISDSINK